MHVMRLRPQERVAVDQERLGALYAQLGVSGAEDVVCRAMEDLALRLSHCDRLYRAQDHAELRKTARGLIAIADQVGMQLLSQIAADVTVSIDHNDTVALAATLSRLLRVGDRSLTAIWDQGNIDV